MYGRRQFLKKCALTIAMSLGASFLHEQQLSRAAGGMFPILVYHRVGAAPAIFGYYRPIQGRFAVSL